MDILIVVLSLVSFQLSNAHHLAKLLQSSGTLYLTSSEVILVSWHNLAIRATQHFVLITG